MAKNVGNCGNCKFFESRYLCPPRMPSCTWCGCLNLSVKLEVLRLAESNRLVRPMSLALARGTIDLFLRPELLPQQTADGEVLTGWYAARIESIVDEQLHLLLGMPSTGQVPHVDYLRTTMSRQVYDSVTQDEKFCELVPGRYLEIGEYGPAKKGHIRVFTMDP